MFSFAKRLVGRHDGAPTPPPDLYFGETRLWNNAGHALRVLYVAPNLVAHRVGLELWFDFIVKINGRELPMRNTDTKYTIGDDGTFLFSQPAAEVDFEYLGQELHTFSHSGLGTQNVELDVWCAKGGVMRKVALPIVPYDYNLVVEEQVTPLYENSFRRLGFTVACQHVTAGTFVWRVLNTHPNSPAFQAKLVPRSDYVIGCDSAFDSDTQGKGLLMTGGESLFLRVILAYYAHHRERLQTERIPIKLYVYNHDHDILRPVMVTLYKSWALGGHMGILGCDVGYGLLHRLPEVPGKFLPNNQIDDLMMEHKERVEYRVPNALNLGVPAAPFTAEEKLKGYDKDDLAYITQAKLGDIYEELANQKTEADELFSQITADSPYTESAGSKTVLPTFTPYNPAPYSPEKAKMTVPPPLAQSVPPPKARKKKQPLAALEDFMNEELTRSKNSDVQNIAPVEGNLPPPPMHRAH